MPHGGSDISYGKHVGPTPHPTTTATTATTTTTTTAAATTTTTTTTTATTTNTYLRNPCVSLFGCKFS